MENLMLTPTVTEIRRGSAHGARQPDASGQVRPLRPREVTGELFAAATMERFEDADSAHRASSAN
jgi:hypothetical protein